MPELRLEKIAGSENSEFVFLIVYQVLGISQDDHCDIRFEGVWRRQVDASAISGPNQWRIRFNRQSRTLERIVMPDVLYESADMALEAIRNHLS
jgi:hypothetical protein